MIRRFLAFAHFDFDSRCAASIRETFTRQNCVDAQAMILFKPAHLIIPPTEQLVFLVVDSEGVVQACIT
jgi:hypothetical protein